MVVRNATEVVRRKGRRADDFSIQMAFIGRQYAQTLEGMVDTLLVQHIPDPALRARAVERLASGEVEHARPLDRRDLGLLGLPVGRLDPGVKDLMMSLILEKNVEGVYYL